MNTTTHRHNLKEQTVVRRSLRNNATAPEAILWLRLKGKQVEGLKFRRQFGVGPYVLDFYCPELRLAIELDGEVHNTSWAGSHDEIRAKFLMENNINILRFKNKVVYQNIKAVIDEIKRYKKQYEQVKQQQIPPLSQGRQGGV